MPYKPVDTAIVVVVGPLIDDTDFKSQETAIAYNAAGMSLDWIQEKTDGTTVKTDLTLTTGGTQDWTHLGNGYYSVEITAAQNNEEGIGWVGGLCTGVLPFESPHYDILPVQVYDSLVKATDKLDVDAYQVTSGAITATAIAADAIGASELAADAVDEILDEVIEGTTTLRQALRLFLSVLTGKASGGGSSSVVFRDIGDTKDRVTMTVDASGNRSAVTRDGS
jgi:hypothetical protein